MLSTKSGAGKLFCSVVCKQLLWEAPVVFLRRSRARLSLRRYTGDLGRSGGSRAGPAARSRRAAGGVRGRTGLGRQRGYSRCSLHIALVPLFQRYLLDLFGLLRLPPLCKCHEDESVGGEGPQWKDVWRRDLSARATWESRSGRSLCAKNRNSAEQQGNDKIRKSGVEQGAGGVCGKAEGRRWSRCPEAPMPAQSRAQRSVLVTVGHAGQQWDPEGCAPAVTLPNQSQALGCKST